MKKLTVLFVALFAILTVNAQIIFNAQYAEKSEVLGYKCTIIPNKVENPTIHKINIETKQQFDSVWVSYHTLLQVLKMGYIGDVIKTVEFNGLKQPYQIGDGLGLQAIIEGYSNYLALLTLNNGIIIINMEYNILNKVETYITVYLIEQSVTEEEINELMFARKYGM